jgi:predicted metal-dependent phosphoesterase TrpH
MLYLAKEHGLTHVAITNHDTVSGLKEAIKLGKEIGIEVIPGIEISAYDFKQNKKTNILGYNFNPIQCTEETMKNLNRVEGGLYFTTDTKRIFLDKDE